MTGIDEQTVPFRPFKPGTLWSSLRRRTAEALRSGALQPLPSGFEFVEQRGIRFLVRLLAGLERKREAREVQERLESASSGTVNPFLPPDPEMFVAEVSATHLALLNKFNVIDHHLLLVTRAFEEQESLLTLEDFQAMWTCMSEFQSLAFYNSGRIAGASQRHKHLQIVPVPLAPEGGGEVPIEPALACAEAGRGPVSSPVLPFVHAFSRFDPLRVTDLGEAARGSLEAYHLLLRATGLEPAGPAREPGQPGPYNLLVTRRWMFLVPRSRECFETISVNALGFAGALLVRHVAELEDLKKRGPLTALRAVGIPLES